MVVVHDATKNKEPGENTMFAKKPVAWRTVRIEYRGAKY